MIPEQFITQLLKQAAALADLQQAKLHSDKGEFRSKRRILTRMMTEAPDDWEIDQPDERMPGIRHKSGYRFHLPARHVKPVLEKAASVALVRNIAKGLLSPTTVQRAASAMPAGQFRTVSNLGRGQFSLVDKVVGNLGGGNVGEFARKLPTRVVPTIQGEYGPVAAHTKLLNAGITPPPVLPFAAVNARGAFQQLPGKTPVKVPDKILESLWDTHALNRAPSGQLMDYSLPSGGKGQLNFQQSMRTRPIYSDPQAATVPMATDFVPRWVQSLGGDAWQAPAHQLANQLQHRSSDLIRKYWATPPVSRPAVLQGIQTEAAPQVNRLDSLVHFLDTQRARQQRIRQPLVPSQG